MGCTTCKATSKPSSLWGQDDDQESGLLLRILIQVTVGKALLITMYTYYGNSKPGVWRRMHQCPAACGRQRVYAAEGMSELLKMVPR